MDLKIAYSERRTTQIKDNPWPAGRGRQTRSRAWTRRRNKTEPPATGANQRTGGRGAETEGGELSE